MLSVRRTRFARWRDLFSVIYTTSRSPALAGKAPDLLQMIVGMVFDAHARPVGSEMWPGNTAEPRPFRHRRPPLSQRPPRPRGGETVEST